jgi:CHAT domain-containing protein/Tfp pilus assembly protein PilF
MDWKPEEENVIRRYLLDDATTEERRRVEERLLEDDDYGELLLLIEGELIDDYAGGAMSEREQSLFRRNFLFTPHRRENLAMAQGVAKYAAAGDEIVQDDEMVIEGQMADDATRRKRVIGSERERSWRRRGGYPGWKIAAYAALVLAMGMGGWWLLRGKSEIEKGLAAFNQAYSRERPLSVRVTGLDYAPFSVKLGGDQTQVDLNSRKRAERILLDVVAESPNSASRHALGRLYLTERNFDQAIAEFEQALKDDPDNAGLHSDLGAALFEKNKREATEAAGRNPHTYNLSLEHLNRAIEIDKSLLAALFNRALLRQSAGLLTAAREDWELYLKQDASSAWAQEARDYLEEIEKSKKARREEEEIFQEFRQAARAHEEQVAWSAFSRCYLRTGNYIFDKLVDEFISRARERSDAEASHSREMLTYAGAMAERHGGDRYFATLAKIYGAASPYNLGVMQQARGLTRQAYSDLSNSSSRGRAIEGYIQAKQLFAQADNFDEMLLAELWLNYCYLDRVEVELSLAGFTRVVETSRAKNYKWLESLALIAVSNARVRRNEYSTVEGLCRQAGELSEQIGDPIGQLRSLNSLANVYKELGKPRQSWRAALQGITLGERIGAEPSLVIGYYSSVARSFHGLGFYSAALDYARETVRLGEAMGQPPLVMSRYLASLGVLYAELGKFDHSLNALNSALAFTQSQEPDEANREMRSYVLLHLARSYRLSGELPEASQTVDEALEYGRRKKDDWLNLSATREKALILLARGDQAGAQATLQDLFAEYDSVRGNILEEGSRSSFLAGEQNIYDIAIDAAFLKDADKARAFNYSERSRARSLLDSMRGAHRVIVGDNGINLSLGPGSPPLSLDEIQQRMPERAQLLQYAVLPDRIIIWVVSSRRVEATAVNTSKARLTGLVADYLAQISRTPTPDKTDHMRKARDLYEILIEPVADFLEPGGSLCIAPDKILNLLPFGALVARKSGKLLIEDYRLTYTPSATLFMLSIEAAKKLGSIGPESILSVGNPRFGRGQDDLRYAAEEAKSVADFYAPHATLLIGPQARKEVVLRHLAKANVIHFATHHLSDPTSPLQSRLLLTDQTAPTSRATAAGDLAAHEIYQLRLPNTRLVTLSACQTQAEDYLDGEGAIGIARSFRAAGAPLVAASLWEADSRATSRLMTEFHRLRKRQGLHTAEALREAQLSLARGEYAPYQHPYYWAAFVLVGGDVNY